MNIKKILRKWLEIDSDKEALEKRLFVEKKDMGMGSYWSSYILSTMWGDNIDNLSLEKQLQTAVDHIDNLYDKLGYEAKWVNKKEWTIRKIRKAKKK